MKKTLLIILAMIVLISLAACQERRTILEDRATGCTYAVRLSNDGEAVTDGHIVADAAGRTTCRTPRPVAG